MPPPRRLASVAELTDSFDGFLVDLWGVVHDGERLYEGVAEVLADLASRGARIVFLSNSSRLGPQLAETLVDMGVPRDAFADVISSGDVTREVLRRRHDPLFSRFAL